MKTKTFLALLLTTLIVRAESVPESGAAENALSSRISLREIAEVSRSRYEVGKANAAEPLAGEVEASKLLESEQDILRNISSEQSQLNVLMNRDAFAPLGQPEQTETRSVIAPMENARALMIANRPANKIAQ